MKGTGTTPFSVDDEYEGGHFGADGEFYYNQKKQAKKFTKEDQTYGIFYEAGSSDEDQKKSKKGGAQAPFVQPTMSKNYLGFVKSDKVLYNPEAGKVRVNLGKKKTAENALKEAKMLEEVAEHAKESKKQKKSVQFNEGKNKEIVFDKNKPVGSMPDWISSGDEAGGMEEEDEDFINNKINQEVLRRKGKFDFKKPGASSQKFEDYGLPTVLGKRRAPAVETRAPQKSTQEEVKEASLEESYGAGWKIMQSLGYKVNTGLGSKEQGRLNPIEAVKKTVLDGKRAEKVVKSEKTGGLADDLMNDLEEEDMEAAEEERPQLWKRGKERNKMNHLRKTNHLRPADITVPETELIKPVIQQKIVDMRGPQVMYFEDYNAMKTLDQGRVGTTVIKPAAKKPAFLGEMLMTLKGHVDKTKYNIQTSERKMRIERDKIINFNYEKTQLEEDQKRLDKDIENLKVLKTRLNQFATQSSSLNDRETLELFRDCFDATPQQFIHLKLDHLFINTITKKLQTSVAGWVIKENTLDEHFDLFLDVKEFLVKILKFKEYLKYRSYTEKSMESAFSPNSAYDETQLEKYLTEIFNKSWLTPLRSYILNDWNPKDPDILILLIEKWKPIVPVVVLAQLYDTVIMQKLQSSVDAWTPTSDRIPIHIWLHPWFPLLGEKRLETLWKSIQLKISQLLMQWEPQDKSALILLKPWLRVFERRSWESLIDRMILPKLMYALRDFEVNPKKQKVDPVRWLIDWTDYLSQDNLVNILENNVLRKIVEVGMEWIMSPNSKIEEIKGWLDGWK